MIKVPPSRHQRYISPSPLTPRVETNDMLVFMADSGFFAMVREHGISAFTSTY